MFTVSNPINSNQTYTFGSKGAKPTWLLLALANGSVKVPDGFKDSKDRAKEAALAKKAERDAAVAKLRAAGIVRPVPKPSKKRTPKEVAKDETETTAEAPAAPVA